MPLRRIVLAAVAAVLYAGCYAAIKAGLVYAPPFRFAALRALVGGVALLVGVAVTGRRIVPARRLWLPIAVLTIVGPVIGFAAMFTSPRHTGAGLASVVGNTGPLFIIVLAGLFLGERITGGKITSLVFSMAGVTLVALPNAASAGSWHAAALALPLVAALSGASESVIVKRVHLGTDVMSVAGWQFLLASVPLFMLSQWLEPEQLVAWSGSFVLLLAFLAGGATAAATGLWYSLVQDEEVSRLSLMLFLVPIAGLALGFLFFGERMSQIQVVGVVLVLTGIGAAAFLRARVAPDAHRVPITP
jgi:O-acetylserine/cysteine efflux transporter